ncbi:Roundabout 1 [Orchesella cincta]|uniref:Roundabout 1 n=1 Tax=Orchesella cincta TaxID=48709 RepID=A0A1D2N2E9_ORCCI|nr:Roundabout 1 [Orchesella cincta]
MVSLRDDFRASPQNTWVAQGDTAVLECEPPRGNPEPKVLWKRNGNLIDVKANGRYRIVGQGSLSISQVRQSDEGRYVCLAKNIVSTRQSNTALLRVTGTFYNGRLLLIKNVIFIAKNIYSIIIIVVAKTSE